MARKADGGRALSVSVVGLSGGERDKGHAGAGKSCLCNRFVRSHADDYSVDHISVLSQTDFGGRVVNNDHFLYWGEVSKSCEEGGDYMFRVIEQTEFIDDASFQPFKGGKMEPYVKRCGATKIASAEKLMYICKNQLGIEKEYEQRVLPDGKLNVDGFICIFDVSVVPSRTLEKQVDFITAVLNNLLKTKKPIVLATTKNDDANEAYVREAEKLIQRKEYRGAIQMVETSAHENVNVDLAFILLAQTVDRCKVRSKIVPYAEAARLRKELMDASTEAFTRLIRAYVTEPRTLWTHACKKLATHKDWVYFVRLFGMDGTQRLFRRHVKRLKDERVARRVARYMDALPEALRELAPDADGDWPTVRQYLRSHPDFDRWFFECGSGDDGTTWADLEPDEPGGDDSRIPFDVLDTSDAETVYRNHVNALQREQRRLEWRKQFRQLLKDTGYVTPGKQLSEVRVLFMGRECFEALSEHECQQIYDAHQRDLVDEAKRNFQELLLEHADLFYHFKSVAPTGTITQDDIKEITDVLRDDFRYKLLDRLDQDRKLMLFRHLGFVHCPMREHCPAYPNCVDAVVERIISARGRQDASGGSDDGRLNVVVVGGGNASVFADELAARIRAECDDDECEVDCRAAREPTAAAPPDFAPHGSFRVYSDAESFERVRESLEKTLLSNLERDERPPFHGLPVVLAFARDPALGDEEAAGLREDGESLADSLQCPFVDASAGGERAVTDALRRLVRGIRRRSGGGPPAPPPRGALPPPPCAIEPDVRIIMCMFCGDPYSVESVLAPLLSQRRCYASAERSLVLETFLGDSKRRVEVIVSSFHGANAFRDELVHGFVLVYSTKRKASLATLDAFSTNIPNLPIQIMAVTDSGGADAFFGDDLSHSLMTEGNATADRLRAHFMTASANARHGAAFYTPFFKEVWEKKPEIEQAFHMEEPCGDSSGRPVPPPRRESYDLDTDARAEGSGDDADPVDDGPSSSERGDAFSFAYDDTTRDGREDGQISTDPWTNNYGQHAFTTGRRHIVAPKSRPKGGAQTLKQPGKLNMKNFVGVEEAIERMTVRSKDPKLEVTSFGHAPLATPENVDLGVEYAQARERAYGHSERDYVYALTHDTAGNKSRPKQRRDKDRPRECRSDTSGGGVNGRLFRAAGYSDTDSEWSSLERRRRAAEIYSKVSRKSTTYKRARKKKTAIPVQPPRVPLQFAPTALPTVVPSSDATGAPSGSDTDSSEGGERERDTNITRLRFQKRPPSLKRRGPIPVGPPFVPETDFSVRLDTADPFGERNSYVIVHDDESGLEVSSPRDDSPLLKGDKVSRKKEKQKSKEDEKREKRRAKDEKPRKAADKERDKKKQKRLKHKGAAGGPDTALPLSIGDYVQSENSTIPLFLEKCVDFIEAEGLDSEGIYRVPGNRAHVDLLFQKFEEDREVDIRDLDVPVNAVATALKDFFSKRLPPLFDDDVIAELEEIAGTRGIKPLSTALEVKTDRSCRLLALRTMLDKLPPSNFRVLEFIFRHFVKVAENSKSNSMDSKNLAICWWPTLLPIEFSDMGRFERMRPYLEDIVQTMIDQYPFLFCGEEAFVMV